MLLEALDARVTHDVRYALEEDLGSGDITAQLVPEDRIWKASVYSRNTAILCLRGGWPAGIVISLMGQRSRQWIRYL